jgi:hypothetical protein
LLAQCGTSEVGREGVELIGGRHRRWVSDLGVVSTQNRHISARCGMNGRSCDVGGGRRAGQARSGDPILTVHGTR